MVFNTESVFQYDPDPEFTVPLSHIPVRYEILNLEYLEIQIYKLKLRITRRSVNVKREKTVLVLVGRGRRSGVHCDP